MKTYVVGQVPSGYAPLPPENVLINGARYPADISGQYTISWAPNPREHMYGPAVSGDETYTLHLYGESDTLIRTVTGITGNSYTWSTELEDSGIAGTPANYDSVVISDSPVAYWKLDETSGTTAIDSVGGYNGTYSGGSTINQSPLIQTGRSALFTANDSGITVPDAAALSFINTGFTLEFWFKVSGTPGVYIIKDTPGSVYAEYQVDGITNGGFNFSTRSSNASTPSVTVTSPTGYNDGVSHHFAAVFTPSATAKIYIDGAERASVSHSLATSFNSTSPLNIGRSGANNTSQIGGSMDAVAFYASALSAARIAAHYTAGLPVYRYNSSIRAELETARGGVTSYQKQIIKSTRSVTTV